MLIARPQEVVTREELQKRLWPGDVMVDFDRALNKAVNRLREALRDDADDPRFIQTLPQRGYRFLVPVEKLNVSVGSTPLARNSLRSGSLRISRLSLPNRRRFQVDGFFSLREAQSVWRASREPGSCAMHWYPARSDRSLCCPSSIFPVILSRNISLTV